MKAILVTDMPYSCKDCHYRVNKGYEKDWRCALSIHRRKIPNYIRHFEKNIDYTKQRPNLCPLKPMLEKMRTDVDDIEENSYLQGWNECIDEILKGGTTMNKLEKAKEIIKEYYKEAQYGIYDSRNTVGDIMSTLYENNELIIDICYNWGYFEVFGLSSNEFIELEKYYYEELGVE